MLPCSEPVVSHQTRFILIMVEQEHVSVGRVRRLQHVARNSIAVEAIARDIAKGLRTWFKRHARPADRAVGHAEMRAVRSKAIV
jgi:hypothetical protein